MPTILFIDDEPVRMSPFVETLEDDGFTVVVATSATDAVSQARAHKNELAALVVDIMLPHGSPEPSDVPYQRAGLWALKQIRDIPELREVPAIILSAVSMQRTTVETAALGVRKYLEKPVNLDDFAREVRGIAMLKGGARP